MSLLSAGDAELKKNIQLRTVLFIVQPDVCSIIASNTFIVTPHQKKRTHLQGYVLLRTERAI